MRQLTLIFCFSSMVSCQFVKNAEQDLEARARKLHEQLTTLDTHVDISVKNFTDSVNYKQDLDTQLTLPKMEAGGLDVAWLIVYTAQDSLTPGGYARARENAMAKFAAIHRLCEEIAPSRIGLALTPADVRNLVARGSKVALIGVENAYPMGEDLANFKAYHEMGARYVSLAHNGHSQFCDSHTGEQDGVWLHNGLSKLGILAVNEMNKLGIMIDISHISKEAMMQVVSLSKAPVIASHSSARALCDHSRNLDDEQLDRIRDNGGVVQTVALDAYLHKEKYEARASYMANLYGQIADSLGINRDTEHWGAQQIEDFLDKYPKIRAMAEEKAGSDADAPPPVDVSDLVDHIDYMVARMGIDHVGISSDFDGGGGIAGWRDASETFNVTLELVKRGYTDEEIAKLWGGNLLRVMTEVQQLGSS